jgi:hypothetical protein
MQQSSTLDPLIAPQGTQGALAANKTQLPAQNCSFLCDQSDASQELRQAIGIPATGIKE